MDWLDIFTIGCGVAAFAVLTIGCGWASYRYRYKPLLDDLRRHVEQQTKDHP